MQRRFFSLVLSALVVGPFVGNQTVTPALGQSLTGSADLGDFPLITQPDGISCGPTCCAMVLKYYGKSAGIGPLKTAAGTRFYEGPNLTGQKIRVGMTHPSGIQKALADYGLLATVQRGTIDDIVDLVNRNRPPILLVRSGTDTWHYVVAIGHRYNVPARRMEIRLADPSGSKNWMPASTLEAAWQYSHDLTGQSIDGRRCRTCGGSGKVGVGPLRANCPLCGGDGRETDYFRKVVESLGVSGRTLISVRASAGGSNGGGSNGSGGNASSTAKIKYTIWNDSGRSVTFRLPSGKTYTLEHGQRGSYENTVGSDALKIHIASTGKTYRLESGNHKFWWKRDESRVAFDLNYKQ
jgi:hypothetical protein